MTATTSTEWTPPITAEQVIAFYAKHNLAWSEGDYFADVYVGPGEPWRPGACAVGVCVKDADPAIDGDINDDDVIGSLTGWPKPFWIGMIVGNDGRSLISDEQLYRNDALALAQVRAGYAVGAAVRAHFLGEEA